MKTKTVTRTTISLPPPVYDRLKGRADSLGLKVSQYLRVLADNDTGESLQIRAK